MTARSAIIVVCHVYFTKQLFDRETGRIEVVIVSMKAYIHVPNYFSEGTGFCPAVSTIVGYLKGKSAMIMFEKYSRLKRNFKGHSFWARVIM